MQRPGLPKRVSAPFLGRATWSYQKKVSAVSRHQRKVYSREESIQRRLLAVQGSGGAKLTPGHGTGRARHRRRSRGGPLTLQQHGNHGVLGFLDEHELAFRTQVDADEVSEPDLSGSHQVGELEHDVALDGPLQV